MDNKKYNNTKLTVGIIETLLSFMLIFLFVKFGLNIWLEDKIRSYYSNDYLVFLLFIFFMGICSAALLSPFSFYSGFYLEHKYNLSNQSFIKWVWESFKAVAVSSLIGIPIMVVFYYNILHYGTNWWLPFAFVLFLFSIILARVVPVFILPLFYKLIPIENESLKNKITHLASEAGIKVENIFKFDMSKNTKKANAAFTGIGKSKRILLGDTLLDNFSEDEIETVIAHELGHYKKKHIIKNILYGTAASFFTLYIVSILYSNSIAFFNLKSIDQVAALPLLALWLMLIGLVQTPLGNILSRKYEYEADQYAIYATQKASIFITTLEKLNKQNLGDPEPHPFIEWYFYSHPSITKRTNAILKIDKTPNNNQYSKQESKTSFSNL